MNGGLRARAILDRHSTVVVVIFLTLAIAGGWITYTTYVEPGTTTQERAGPSWETTGLFDHEATVRRTNPVYSENTTLENRSIYFESIAPVLEGTYVFTYDASESGQLNERISLSLVIEERIKSGKTDSETVLWQTVEPLTRVNRTAVQPGEIMRVPFGINISTIGNTTERIQKHLGSSPGELAVRLRSRIHLQGNVNGKTIQHSNTDTLSIEHTGETYRVSGAVPTTHQFESTRTVTVDQTYGPFRRMGGPLALITALGGLFGTAIASALGWIGLSETEQEQLAYEDDRKAFDEWITTIRLPDEAFDRPRADAMSLGALVDFAIDTDNSVIEDPTRDAYYVVHDDFLYSYRPPSSGHERSILRQSEDYDGHERDDRMAPVAIPTHSESDLDEDVQGNFNIDHGNNK